MIRACHFLPADIGEGDRFFVDGRAKRDPNSEAEQVEPEIINLGR